MSRRFARMRSARAGGITRASCLRRMASVPGLVRGKASPRPKVPRPQLPKPPRPRDTASEVGLRLRLELDRAKGGIGTKPVFLDDDTPQRRRVYIRLMKAAGYTVKLEPRARD